MPADDGPSFHWRPSTTSTFLPLSSSIRQKPTTGTNAFGSAPTVSPARSTVVGGAARPGSDSAAKPIADTMVTLMLFPMLMVGLLPILGICPRGVAGAPTTQLPSPPPGPKNTPPTPP